MYRGTNRHKLSTTLKTKIRWQEGVRPKHNRIPVTTPGRATFVEEKWYLHSLAPVGKLISCTLSPMPPNDGIELLRRHCK